MTQGIASYFTMSTKHVSYWAWPIAWTEDVASAAPGCLGVSVCERERETTVGVEM